MTDWQTDRLTEWQTDRVTWWLLEMLTHLKIRVALPPCKRIPVFLSLSMALTNLTIVSRSITSTFLVPWYPAGGHRTNRHRHVLLIILCYSINSLLYLVSILCLANSLTPSHLLLLDLHISTILYKQVQLQVERFCHSYIVHGSEICTASQS